MVFPIVDAGTVNVKEFGAKGDGSNDDTAAIQAVLNAHPNGRRIIYLPNGTYLVSKTITWPAGTAGKGDEYKETITCKDRARAALRSGSKIGLLVLRSRLHPNQ